MKKLALLVALFVAGCGPVQVSTSSGGIGGDTSSAGATVVPRWEVTPCEHELADDSTTHCGYVIVPSDWPRENRPPQTTETLKIYHVIFPAKEPKRAEPFLYLTGGPGAATADAVSLFENPPPPEYGLPDYRATFGGDQDLIVVDQRGSNRSGGLYCSEELGPLRAGVYGLSYRDAADQRVNAIVKCRTRLEREGIDLSAFDTWDLADDIKALRDVRGYDQVVLFGASYGTRLAMMTMRRHPEIVRAVIIDSILPPEVNPFVEEVQGTQHGLRALFDATRKQYPDLEKMYDEINARLEKNPVKVTAHHYGGNPPKPTDDIPVTVTGVKFVSYVTGELRTTPYKADLPKTIKDIYDNENYQVVADSWLGNIDFFFPEGEAGTGAASIGLFESVFAANDAHYATPKDVQDNIDERVKDDPALASWLQSNFIYSEPSILGKWPVNPLPESVRDPVQSDIPTLMMVGALDVATPSIFSKPSAIYLSNSFYFEILSGHATSYLPCVVDIITQFISDPSKEPNNTCPTEYAWTPSD